MRSGRPISMLQAISEERAELERRAWAGKTSQRDCIGMALASRSGSRDVRAQSSRIPRGGRSTIPSTRPRTPERIR